MQQNPTNAQGGQSMSEVELQACMQDCLKCHTACMQTAKKYQKSGGDQTHLQMLQDCAELCLTTAHFMEHNSELSVYVAAACARVTTHCGEKCNQMGDTDCANACQNAAWSCGQIAKLVA